jgi:predicted xylose isomerase-like sugar epimerase
MPLQFTQEEVENAVAKHLHHGDRVEIARNSGLSESWVKRQLEFLEVVTSVDIKNVNTNRYSINVEMSSPSAQKFIENYRAELRERCRKLESEAKGL